MKEKTENHFINLATSCANSVLRSREKMKSEVLKKSSSSKIAKTVYCCVGLRRPILVSWDTQRFTSFREGNHWRRVDLIPESTITFFRSSSAGGHPDKGGWPSVQLWGSISEPQLALSNMFHVFDPQFHHLSNGCNNTSSSFTRKGAQHSTNIGQCPPLLLLLV